MSGPDIKRSRQREIWPSGLASDQRRQFVLWGEHPAAAVAIRSRPIFMTHRQAQQIPEEALLASLGCGNPTALAKLNPGEVVLDLGSGGGIDVLLSAKRVGPTGKAYGLDMTDEMLALANENKRKAGVENVEFLKGEIEHIPLPDDSVDVIISNCVINLSADKDRVLEGSLPCPEAGRTLCCVRCCDSRRDAARDSQECASVGWLRCGSARRERIPQQTGVCRIRED